MDSGTGGLFCIATVGHGLELAVFLFQLGLHVKVELALPLYSLLLHVTKDTCVHCLISSQKDGNK